MEALPGLGDDAQVVLILIIMEDTHGEIRERASENIKSLNPYYNGRYSWRIG